jgi:NAD(P)H dehydrogenase (quinone)
MKISLMLAHPDPSSFNHALAMAILDQLITDGHTVKFHDLYQEGFPSDLPVGEIHRSAILPAIIQLHCTEISEAEGIIVIHPNWWGQPPAILKGWIDRVIRPGVAYQFVGDDKGEGVPVGLLKARQALVLNTSNTLAEREDRVFGDPLETIWKNCIFGLCGVARVERRVFRVVVTSTLEERQNWLSEAAQLAHRLYH